MQKTSPMMTAAGPQAPVPLGLESSLHVIVMSAGGVSTGGIRSVMVMI